jgi:chromate transporter
LTQGTPLREIAALFLRLGTVAFGGPAAHIALMEDEVVRRRGWLSAPEFLDLVGATAVIPGPNSTELAIHIGYARGGWRGLLVAGIAFILPASLIVSALAWLYVRFGTRPAAAALLAGVEPVVIAVILQAAWRLGRAAARTTALATLGGAALAAALSGVDEITVLGASAFAMAAFHIVVRARGPRPPSGRVAAFAAVGTSALSTPAPSAALLGVAAAAVPYSLGGLFLEFVKVGAVLFGSGYVLVAFLQRDLVERLGWITPAQLLDAVAIGQVTPGPVFTTATFIGYLLGGGAGAIAATVGIFLPAFVFVAASRPFLPRIRRSPLAAAVLDGLIVASLALMVAVALRLGRGLVTEPLSLGIALLAAVLLFRFRVNAAWVTAGGAAAGLVASLL